MKLVKFVYKELLALLLVKAVELEGKQVQFLMVLLLMALSDLMGKSIMKQFQRESVLIHQWLDIGWKEVDLVLETPFSFMFRGHFPSHKAF